jgi:hypothetical protein
MTTFDLGVVRDWVQQLFENDFKTKFFFSELFKMAVKASRDSSGVGEAQHT